MSNFGSPFLPFSVCPNGSKLGKTRPTPGHQKLDNESPPTPTPIPFDILAKNWNAKKKTKMLSKA